MHRAKSATAPTSNYDQGPVAVALGDLATLLERNDDAERHYGSALELSQRLRSPFLVARCEIQWSKMLVKRGDSGDLSRARDMLVDARQIGDRCQLGYFEDQARALL
jgi:hypothetical protein